MPLSKKKAVLAETALATMVSQPYFYEAQPVVMVSQQSMPQSVPEGLLEIDPGNYLADAGEDAVPDKVSSLPSAVALYYQLRRNFGISHTEMANWLGVKRRSLYNWISEPERSTKLGPEIEERLVSLLALNDEMESEHRPFLFKIAFSPIYGDPNLGKAILAGADSEALLDWYDQLFSRFESYRLTHAGNQQLA